MPDQSNNPSAALQRAFADYEREVALQNYKVGCFLGIVFMPAGSFLDYFVYPPHTVFFLWLRIWCSLLLGCVWVLLLTAWGRKHYRTLGLVEVSLPLFFMSGMIYITEGPSSPYYAGLNLVLLGAGLVLRWTLQDSIAVILMAMGMYLLVCWAYGQGQIPRLFFNNLYFLFVTGVFIITGNYFYSRMRFREFALRFELDQNRQKLEESNRKLVELDRVKSRFFANISHELRTPLTLLLAPLETLLHSKKHTSSGETSDLLNTMNANGMRLLKLINDLLDLVRLESGKMDVRLEPVAGGEFVRGLGNAVRQVAEDKRLSLTTNVNHGVGTFLADRDKLEKIVLNLLFNAVKFTPSGGSVELRAERQKNLLVLQVQDTGMGISEEQLPFLFKRFWQADSSARRKYQGTGIGLALVKELVEIHGGTVSVASRLGKGTTFTVQLPYLEPQDKAQVTLAPELIAPKNQTAEVASPSSTSYSQEWLSNLYRRAELFPSLSPLRETLRQEDVSLHNRLPKVLIADDEPDMLRFLNSQLSGQFQVLEAVDGQQAVEKARQFLPDLILCDMMMPEKDGMAVCRELREQIATKNIPFVLLTARADEETKLSALSAGASDFISKPFSTTELHVRLKNLVESHQLQRQLARQNQILEATLEQLKETETQLVQSEKLASLGRLSAGIIHEINNPLNYIKNGLFFLKNKLKTLPVDQVADYEEVLGDVQDGVERVKTIVSDLRTFTHPNSEQLEPVKLEQAVEAALRFLSHEWKDKVRIERRIPPDQTITGNPNRMIQVLINLLQNSLDALRKKSFDQEQPTIEIEGRQEAGLNKLIIRDNGEGISREHLDKVFDPFFTTKDVGEGMGLGLSICYRIIQEHGGKISVRSEPGKYCEFSLAFPGKV